LDAVSAYPTDRIRYISHGSKGDKLQQHNPAVQGVAKPTVSADNKLGVLGHVAAEITSHRRLLIIPTPQY